ncbi:hypothetical protein M23134_01852 [Microscilla marina ATCC 23134]|uniref:Uncharacterized protein n=1 Tax=Microscilla marina ATCC 23134 TaxID=313606 RepID=A1ZC21_MICM2|nr:hypothetical protein M23134_01852 [Microscilla marina ATCC 23134]
MLLKESYKLSFIQRLQLKKLKPAGGHKQKCLRQLRSF